MKIDNGIVRCDFDPANGSPVQITDLRQGQTYLRDPNEGLLFRLFAQDDAEWIDRYADSHESGPPEMRLKGETLIIHPKPAQPRWNHRPPPIAHPSTCWWRHPPQTRTGCHIHAPPLRRVAAPRRFPG